MTLNRSFLFAPGNVPRRVEKALTLDADAVIVDLEDSVAAAEKAATRKSVADALSRPRRGRGYVRVNAASTPYCYGDLVETLHKGVDGVVLPKVESAAELHAVDWLIANLERERGVGGRLDRSHPADRDRGRRAAHRPGVPGAQPAALHRRVARQARRPSARPTTATSLASRRRWRKQSWRMRVRASCSPRARRAWRTRSIAPGSISRRARPSRARCSAAAAADSRAGCACIPTRSRR